MSEAKHTLSIPTPIECDWVGHVFCGDVFVCDTDIGGNDSETIKAYARDICRCVNTHAALIGQRDALKTALEILIKQYQIYTNFVDHEKCWEIIQARAALAKCDKEGDKP